MVIPESPKGRGKLVGGQEPRAQGVVPGSTAAVGGLRTDIQITTGEHYRGALWERTTNMGARGALQGSTETWGV